MPPREPAISWSARPNADLERIVSLVNAMAKEASMPRVTRCIDCTRAAADAFEGTAWGLREGPTFICSNCGCEWRWATKRTGWGPRPVHGGWLECWELVSDPDPWPGSWKPKPSG